MDGSFLNRQACIKDRLSVFSTLPGEMIKFDDHIFHMGWFNQQLLPGESELWALCFGALTQLLEDFWWRMASSGWKSLSGMDTPHPKWWFSKGIPLISGKSRLVRYYNLARVFLFQCQKEKPPADLWEFFGPCFGSMGRYPVFFFGYIYHKKNQRNVPGPSSLGAKWFRYRVSIRHPWGYNWHPLEGADRYIYIYYTWILWECLTLSPVRPRCHAGLTAFAWLLWRSLPRVRWCKILWRKWGLRIKSIWAMKKPCMLRVCRGWKYYPGMWGLFHKPWNKDPYETTRIQWEVRVFFCFFFVAHLGSMFWAWWNCMWTDSGVVQAYQISLLWHWVNIPIKTTILLTLCKQ